MGCMLSMTKVVVANELGWHREQRHSDGVCAEYDQSSGSKRVGVAP